ncbi:DEAD/DEAH box helicase family protein [Kitasatospora purpeofusca]|uniref:DEAD/DEAH box helicase family protein n=1 Tax=Kitasatospora purpeofusca TaxID=67352 RepID=UPI0033CB7BF9
MHGGLRSPLRGHQDLAVDSCVSVFKEGASRATVTMATGSGKTHVALNTVHEVAPNGRALVVVPSLRLLEQTAALPPTSSPSRRPASWALPGNHPPHPEPLPTCPGRGYRTAPWPWSWVVRSVRHDFGRRLPIVWAGVHENGRRRRVRRGIVRG